MSLQLRVAAVVVVWLVATILLTMAYVGHGSRAPPEPPPETITKGDRQPIRVIPTTKPSEPAPPMVWPAPIPAPPPVDHPPPMDHPPPVVKAEPAPPPKEEEQPRERRRNVCDRTGGRRVETRGGRSWHCEYEHGRRRHRRRETEEQQPAAPPPQQKPTWWPF